MAAINIKTLGRSSLAGGLAQVWRILSRFILTPIIISQIGMSGYGVWTLVFSIAAYVDMSNLSLGLAYTKFTAECVAHRRYEELGRIIGSGIALVVPFGVLGLGLAWMFGDAFLEVLKVPPDLIGDAKWALLTIIAMMVLRMTVGCRLEVLAGLQRIDLTFQLNVLASLIEFLVSLPLLFLDYGLLGLAIGHAAGQVTINFAAYSMVRQRLPQVKISPFSASRDGLRKIMSVGGRFQLLSMLNTVVMQGIKLVLSWLMGVEWLAVYELADKLIKLGATASEAVIAPLMPAFASLRAGGDVVRERLLFIKGSKADALFGGTAFMFLALLASPILILWTGQSQEWAAWAIQVLAISEATGLLTSIVSSSLRSQGLVGLESTRGLLNAGLGIALLFMLVPSLEFQGLIYARVISALLTTVWYLRAYFRFSSITWREYLEGTRIPVLAVLLVTVGGAIFLLRAVLPPLTIPGLSPRWTAVVEVMLWSVPYLGLIGAGVWRAYLTGEDREQIAVLGRAIVKRLRKRERREPPEVLVVADVSDDDSDAVVDAAIGLGRRVEAMDRGGGASLLASGADLQLVLVVLADDGDPMPFWTWILHNRPDLRARIAFVGGSADASLYADEGVRHYAEPPDVDRLRADWGSARSDADEG